MSNWKQSKFTKYLKISGTFNTASKGAESPSSILNKENFLNLGYLSKGREALREERVGLIEDSFVLEITDKSNILKKDNHIRDAFRI